MLKPQTFAIDAQFNQSTQEILYWFERISQIPRRSKHEDQIKKWLTQFAADRGFDIREDQGGNLVVYVPGQGELKAMPALVIQSHLDMVCEKVPTSKHDFAKDPLKLYVHDGWVRAKETSLGADNGIAIAMSLAIANSKTLSHPPLELLFTIDEETGLTGANSLDKTVLSGKVMINIDSEEDGVFIIGCAGGAEAQIKLDYASMFSVVRADQLPKDYHSFYLGIDGLSGGHSGIDIHKQKANAIKILFRVMQHLAQTTKLVASQFTGGSAHNAIPRSSGALIVLPLHQVPDVQLAVDEIIKIVRKEYIETDPKMEIVFRPEPSLNSPVYLDHQSLNHLTNFVLSFPTGPAFYSAQNLRLVETSNNLATIKSEGGQIYILSSQRSAVKSRLKMMCDQIRSLTELAGGECAIFGKYPPWEPAWEAKLLQKSLALYQSEFGQKPRVEVIHAGLECGIIGEKYPQMEMISFGPDIINAHSPDEALKITSVEKTWQLLVKLVQTAFA